MVQDIGELNQGSIPVPVKFNAVSPTFFRNYVVQALSGGDGPSLTTRFGIISRVEG